MSPPRALRTAYAGPGIPYAEVRGNAVGRRIVRILFDHETGLARADELCGDLIIEPVTDGKWEDLNDVEITARLYSWVRELPVSRLDAP